MRTLTSKIRRKIHSRVFIDYGQDYTDSMFLAGSGRSGTTWISDIINYRNQYRYIFEPFHPRKAGIFEVRHEREYLRPENRESGLVEPIEALLSGRIRSDWIDKFNRKFLGGKRLIKAIRANLLLKWIHTNCPGVPIVLLLRHPCAVAHSQLKLASWAWNADPEQFLAQEELMEDFLEPFRQIMENVQTDFEKHILLVCIENYLPLKQFKRDEIHLAFYENFCVEPEREIDRLFSFLGESYDERVFDQLRTPSPVSRKGSAVVSGGSLVDSWRKHVTEEQVRDALKILSAFGLDMIYAQDSMPNVDNAYGMMMTS